MAGRTTLEITAPLERISTTARIMQAMRNPGQNKMEFIIQMLKSLQLAVASDKLSDKEVMKSIAYAAENMADGIYKCTIELPEGSDDYR